MVFSQLSGQNFEDYFKTGRNDRYELMCDVYAYDRMHTSGPGNGTIGGDRLFSTTPSIDSLEPIGNTINLIDNWIQCFEDNYGERTGLHKKNTRYLFQKTPLYLPTRKSDYYKNNNQTK